VAPQLIFNLHVDGWLTVFFAALLWIIVLDMAYTVWRVAAGRPVLPLRESAAVPALDLAQGERA
jgi:carbon starvation protein